MEGGWNWLRVVFDIREIGASWGSGSVVLSALLRAAVRDGRWAGPASRLLCLQPAPRDVRSVRLNAGAESHCGARTPEFVSSRCGASTASPVNRGAHTQTGEMRENLRAEIRKSDPAASLRRNCPHSELRPTWRKAASCVCLSVRTVTGLLFVRNRDQASSGSRHNVQQRTAHSVSGLHVSGPSDCEEA
jgi:hypothetical protein